MKLDFFKELCNPLLLNSFLAALGASICGGIVGTYIVVRRIVSISGSISHSMLGGIGLTLWIQYHFNLNFSPIYGALIGSILLSIFIGKIHLKYREREDALIAMIWSIGMAIGIIFFAMIPGFNTELIDFLLGNILWINGQDLRTLFILDAVIILTTIFCHNRFKAFCFDERYMSLKGQSPQRWYFLLLALIAAVIVLLIYIMGIILMLSMLVLPVAIACRFSYKMSKIMVLSSLLNVIFSFSGIILAYILDLPVGPTIALLMGIFYGLSLCIKASVKA